MMQDMCILVVSCDKYADCWTPFSDCMRKFWPDCPYPVYLCTESGEPEMGQCTVRYSTSRPRFGPPVCAKPARKSRSHTSSSFSKTSGLLFRFLLLPCKTSLVLCNRRKTSASFTSIKKFTACRYGSRTATFICSLPKLPIACRSPCHLGPRFSVDSIS